MIAVSFTLNDSPAGCFSFGGETLFAEIVMKSRQFYGFQENNKTTFFVNGSEIKSDSSKKLNELGVVNNMITINIKCDNMPVNFANQVNNAANAGNFQMNNNQYVQGNFQNGNPGFVNQGYANPVFMYNPGFPNQGYGYMNPVYMNQQYMYNGYMNMAQNQNQNNQNQNNQSAAGGAAQNLSITFIHKGTPIIVQTTSDTKFCDVYKKFHVKAGNPQNPLFSYNSLKFGATETRTLSQLNIPNNANINVIEGGSQQPQQPQPSQPSQPSQSFPSSGGDGFLNIIFTLHGKIINFQATKDTKISDLAKRFAAKAGNPEETPTFFMNSKSIDINQDKTLQELGINNQAKIDVVFSGQVIGA